MSLTGFLSKHPLAKPSDYTYPPDIIFEPEIVYSYFYPYFEKINKKTGEFIDLYGDADFYGDSLMLLKENINETLEKIKQESETITVLLGTKESGEKVYENIDKEILINFSKKFLIIIEVAIDSQSHLIFIGD